MKKSRLRQTLRLLNFYGPYLGAGIRVKKINDDFTRFEVEMKLRWYNRNLFGTHFGGSLYAMCDPFFVFIVAQYLGSEYIVWDKSAKIDFLKPGKGAVRAVFEISEEKLSEIKREADASEKITFWLETFVTDDNGLNIAKVEKEIYVRRKN